MVKLKNLLLVVMFFVGFTTSVYAGDHPEANFGIYGIQHFATVVQYQQTYVGQVVQYLPEKTGGGYMDTKYFQAAGGKFNTDYVISRRTRQTLWGGRTDANPKLSLNDT